MTAPKPPSLSASVIGLLRTVARGARPDDVVFVLRRCGRALGASELRIPVAQVSGSWIPGSLLAVLEESIGFTPWVVRLAVQASVGVSLGAVVATFAFQQVMRNPHKPASPYGRVPVWPEDQIAAAIERAAAWLPPTLTIDSRSHVYVLWGLEDPLRVKVQDAAARHLVDRVAERVGALPLEQAARLDSLEIPLPGSRPPRIASADAGAVTCVQLAPDRRYTLAAIEAALAGAPVPAPSTDSPVRAAVRARR